MSIPSKETIMRSITRALWAGVLSAIYAFVVVPVDLVEPKKYILVLSLSMGTAFLMGIQKFISGFIKYDSRWAKKN